MKSPSLVVLLTLPLLGSVACGHPAEEAPAPPVSGAAVEGLAPGQAARSAALITEIRGAGQPCDTVARAFLQGDFGGGQTWNVACGDGNTYGIVPDANDTIRVLSCAEAEGITGTKCFEPF